MKLRLQLASRVSAPVKPGPTEAHGKSGFGATMQELMAMPLSGKPTLPRTAQAIVGTQSQVKNPASGRTPEAGEDSTEEGREQYLPHGEAENGKAQIRTIVAAVPNEQITLPGEPLQDQSVQQSKTAPVSGKSSADQSVQDTILEKPSVQDAIIREQPQMVTERGELTRQPAGVVSHPSGLDKNASSRARHEAGGAKGEGGQPAAAGQLSNVPVVPQMAPVTLPMQQPETMPPPSAPKAEDARVPDASRRAFVPVVVSFGDLRGGSNLNSELVTVALPQPKIAPTSAKLTESARSETNADLSDAHPVPMRTGKADASTVAPPNPLLHTQAPSSEGLVANAKQIDTHAEKEIAKKVGSELGSEIPLDNHNHAISLPAATQHQAVANPAPQGVHGAQKTIEGQRPQASAAQVLQRLDMAATPGAVQLRADARRLDVGVASGTLGWVEVRATTSASGRVDATLQVQSDSSAHVLASQSRAITDYAREHSAPLGELSVGVGTGGSARDESRSAHSDGHSGSDTQARKAMRPPTNDEHTYRPADTVSFISVRA